MTRSLDNKMYEFHLTTTDGVVLTWTNLTKREATMMYALMQRFNPLRSSTEAARFGWKEMT